MGAYTSIVTVTDLASGASITLPHGVTAAVPNSVWPNGATPIGVTALTATTITFENFGSIKMSAKFMVAHIHSIQAADSDIPSPFVWTGEVGGGGGSDVAIKYPVKAASTPASGNIVLAGGVPATLDSVPLLVGDRFLPKNQTNPIENGIYVVTIAGPGGTAVRAADMDAPGEVTGMTLVGVQEGNAYPVGNADTFWFVTTDGVIVIGVDPIDWALYPTTAIFNASNRPWRDAVLNTSTVYVRTTGSDAAGDGSLANPFASINRAVQALPWAPNYDTVIRIVDVGAGSFDLPDVLEGLSSTYINGTTSVASSFVVDAATPVNTPTTGNRLVLTGAAFAVDAMIGRLVLVTSGAAAGRYMRVYKNDATTIWVVTDSYTIANDVPVAGDTLDFLTLDTILICGDNGFTMSAPSNFFGSVFQWCKFIGNTAAGFVDTVAGTAGYYYCNVATSQSFFVDALGDVVLTGCYFESQIWAASPTSTVELLAGNVIDGVNLYGEGVVTLQGENAVIRTTPQYAVAQSQGRILSDDVTNGSSIPYAILRLDDAAGALRANDAGVGTPGSGGNYRLPEIRDAANLAGVQGGAPLTGMTGPYMVDIGFNSGVMCVLASSGGITSTVAPTVGVSSPVAIGGVLRSADVSGTRITNGIPAPGPLGPKTRTVAAGDPPFLLALDATLDHTILCNTAGGVVAITLPAAATVTDGAAFTVSKITTDVNDVTLTPAGTDTFQNVAAAFSLASLGAGLVSVTFQRQETVAGVSAWRLVATA